MKKNMFFAPVWAMVAAIGFAACDKDNKSPNVDDVVVDGFYVVGEAAGYTERNVNALLKAEPNEAASNETRAGFYGGYVWLEANKDFRLVEYAVGAEPTPYGGELSTVAGGATDEPAVNYLGGTFAKNGAAYKVATTGLYHVAADKTLGKAVVVPVSYWSIIGDPVGGWNDAQKLEPKDGASKDKVEFERTGVAFSTGNYKFRHSGGWKVTIGEGVKANTNFGGAVAALVVGGADIAATADQENQVYTVNLTWTPTDGYKATITWTSVLEVNVAGSATFNVTIPDSIAIPAGETAYIWVVGNFTAGSGDWSGQVMTKGSGNTYALTTAVPANLTYKYAVSMSGDSLNMATWWNYEENHANRRMSTTLTANDVVESWRKKPWLFDAETQVLGLVGDAWDGGNWGADTEIPLRFVETDKTTGFSTYKAENVALLAGKGFKVRQDHDWNGVNVGYDAARILGDVTNFVDEGGNIKVVAAQDYTSIVFAINWTNSDWTLTFTK
jgi:hypothetical protein